MTSILKQITLDKEVKVVRIIEYKLADLRKFIQDHFESQWSRLAAIDTSKQSLSMAPLAHCKFQGMVMNYTKSSSYR